MSADRVADWRKRFAAESIMGLEDRGAVGPTVSFFPSDEVAQSRRAGQLDDVRISWLRPGRRDRLVIDAAARR